MSLGAFSVSLSVKDLSRSLEFYGFEKAGGDVEQGWAILRHGSTTIGLFAGMFEGNILTFNPGWADDASPLASFEDVRDIEARLEAAGVAIDTKATPGDAPTHTIFKDPDGNVIMLDQHVPRAGGDEG